MSPAVSVTEMVAAGLVACFKPANQPTDVDGSYKTCAMNHNLSKPANALSA
jgi:hypothetical protein